MPYKDPEARKRHQKAYHASYDKAYFAENKARIYETRDARRAELKRWFQEEIKSKLKCSRCPEDFWACIEFHHLDEETKDYSVSDMLRKAWSKARILKEIAKCIPLCANCHRKEHFEKCPRGPARSGRLLDMQEIGGSNPPVDTGSGNRS